LGPLLQELDGAIPWDTLLFVIGHINYGGRVTDDNDRQPKTSVVFAVCLCFFFSGDFKGGTSHCWKVIFFFYI